MTTQGAGGGGKNKFKSPFQENLAAGVLLKKKTPGSGSNIKKERQHEQSRVADR